MDKKKRRSCWQLSNALIRHNTKHAGQRCKITISLWQSHFANIPAELVYQAVNRHIAKSSYAPAISEINDELHIIHLNALETITGMFTDATAGEIERAERIDRLLSGYEQNQRRLPE